MPAHDTWFAGDPELKAMIERKRQAAAFVTFLNETTRRNQYISLARLFYDLGHHFDAMCAAVRSARRANWSAVRAKRELST